MRSTNPTPTAATGDAGPVAGFTPGEWKFGSHSAHIYSTNGKHIATIHGLRLGYGNDPQKTLLAEEDRNNARLICMAPTLLRQVSQLRAALKRLMPYADTLLEKANMSRQFEIGYVAALQSARAALASVQPEAKP